MGGNVMREQLTKIRDEAKQLIMQAADLTALNNYRVQILGKKGALTAVLRGLGSLSAEERPLIGQLANQVRAEIENLIAAKQEQLEQQAQQAKLTAEQIDITLPGRVHTIGRQHPLALVQREIEKIFVEMGFDIIEGPEVELDYYNFEALNTPPDHPARDTQDTFYINERVLLRTQTSPIQIHTMEKQKPPIRMIGPGRVYRSDTPDVTHSPMFHQIEGLVVDQGISFADLKGTLINFVEKMFGAGRGVRFRPHHFPFTEPSAEVDISCIKCNGQGCRVCGGTGWLEILGAGLVHPRVLEMVGYDPNQISGFAFGMGVERIAMLKYGVDDIRLFFENDMRFLQQF